LARSIVFGAVAAVVAVSALRSWKVGSPGIPQVVISVVLVATGAMWFWIFAVMSGLATGRRLRRSAANSQEVRRSLTVEIDKYDQRARWMRSYLPLAGASAVVGFLVLLV
jgi:hypothetical protein